MRSDIVPGARFPDYELTDHTRTRRRLSELQGIDPMILILSRGHYCPKDHQQHLEMAAFYPKINVAYTKIVTISTDNILETNEFRDGVGAQLCDHKHPRRPRSYQPRAVAIKSTEWNRACSRGRNCRSVCRTVGSRWSS